MGQLSGLQLLLHVFQRAIVREWVYKCDLDFPVIIIRLPACWCYQLRVYSNEFNNTS